VIVSHEYRFIFIKTRKTAGTSLEVLLSGLCAEGDVVTPILPPEPGHVPRNYEGMFDPRPEMRAGMPLQRTLQDLVRRRRYFNHMPASLARARLSKRLWRDYFTFSIERNPWDKTISHFHSRQRLQGDQLTFEEYLARGDLCLNYPIYTVPGDPRRLMVDRVIRYEQLDSDLADVLGPLGVPFKPPLGIGAKGGYRTDRRPYQEVYTSEQRDLVARAFAPEIELHGYTFV
jgi:hypothetical protein